MKKGNFGLLFVIFFVVANVGCAKEKFDQMTVGYIIEDGKTVQVEEVEFDNSWSIPGSKVSCCWMVANVASVVFDKAAPKMVEVKWRDLKENKRRVVKISLPNNLGKRISNLPQYTEVRSREKKKSLMLYIAFEVNNSISIWISNAPHETEIAGRVVEKIASSAE